jgi:glycosyltransferase involved in cell wall biosynthesis
MNVLILTQTLSPGGAEKQALLLAKCLQKHHKVTIVVYYENKICLKSAEILKQNRISYIELKGGHFHKVIRLYQIFTKKKIQIAFLYLLLPNLIGAVIGKLAGVKFTIGGIRSSKIDYKKMLVNKILHNYINYKTIYNNYSGYKYLSSKGFYSEKGIVIPNGFEILEDYMARGKSDQVNILTVGRFHESKDFETSIKAICLLRNDFGSMLNYTIIGWGALEPEIRGWINYYGVNSITKIVINPPNLNEYYIKSDLYLQTSIYEGLSNTIMEAMHFSLPIVATEVGDNRELVKPGINGFLCPPGNAELISISIAKLICDADLRNEFGLNSYNCLRDKYSIESFTDRYINFIEKL